MNTKQRIVQEGKNAPLFTDGEIEWIAQHALKVGLTDLQTKGLMTWFIPEMLPKGA